MYDPTRIDDLRLLTVADLARLPAGEDDRHEYKSSKTPDKDLPDKIARAASAFWNSGGGLFVAGVDDAGGIDGGFAAEVGRQSRRDWVDAAVRRVSPPGRYVVNCLAGDGLPEGRCVILVGFAPSNGGPHQAPDHRYYVRAGARSEPAVHFLVEAIAARRSFRKPELRPVIQKSQAGQSMLHLGIYTVNGVPAYDVEVALSPVPSVLGRGVDMPLRYAVLSDRFPVVLPVGVRTLGSAGEGAFDVVVRFRDEAGEEMSATFRVDLASQGVQ